MVLGGRYSFVLQYHSIHRQTPACRRCDLLEFAICLLSSSDSANMMCIRLRNGLQTMVLGCRCYFVPQHHSFHRPTPAGRRCDLLEFAVCLLSFAAPVLMAPVHRPAGSTRAPTATRSRRPSCLTKWAARGCRCFRADASASSPSRCDEPL